MQRSSSGFALRWGQRRTEAVGGAGPPAAGPGAQCRTVALAGTEPSNNETARTRARYRRRWCRAPSFSRRSARAPATRCGPLLALGAALRRTMQERSLPAGGNIMPLCLARGRRGACQRAASGKLCAASPVTRRADRITLGLCDPLPRATPAGGRSDHAVKCRSRPSPSLRRPRRVQRLNG